MHLPCVLILFAAVTRPVGVGAHVEPSDVVTSDGQVEVVRQLRVQEQTHSEDAEERMNSFNLGGEEVTSYILSEASTSTSNLAASHEMAGANIANIKSGHETGTFSINDRVNDFVKRAIDLRTLKENLEANQKDVYMFNTVLSGFDKDELPKILSELNIRYANKDIDPREVFQNYELHLAGISLFEKPQMEYWIQYLYIYCEKRDANSKVFEFVLETLLNFYSLETLAIAASRAPDYEVALKLGKTITNHWVSQGKTPNDVFTMLDLDKGFDNCRVDFWVNYFTSHYFMQSKRPNLLELKKVLREQPLGVFLRYAKVSDVTLSLVEEEKSSLLKFWKNSKIPINTVLKEVDSIKKEGKNTVYGSAIMQAAIEYYALHLEKAITEEP
ncbi:unnamed protein product [Peronospora farinosa]|uniref:RxLR effector protein n=1 Tax=Peronospora farinosa TaxID=134698 RepID=A0AAV0SW34_9STRA|nr:unnamed protein product [Peronospora farinosa]CAI5709445.1 unnamed protein product [Peronospora farinosa]